MPPDEGGGMEFNYDEKNRQYTIGVVTHIECVRQLCERE
jgi:hypothetical protein